MRTQGSFFQTCLRLIRGMFKGKQICFIGRNVRLGSNVRLGPLVFIDDNVIIGSNTFVGYGSVIRPYTVIGFNCSFGHLTVIEGKCNIGNEVSFHAQCHITKGTIVEDNVFFAPFYLGTNTNTIDHGRNLNPLVEGPIIKRAARIGAGVILTPGIVIGENAVLGAGSLVTKNVPDKEVWFGRPAKKIKEVPEGEIL